MFEVFSVNVRPRALRNALVKGELLRFPFSFVLQFFTRFLDEFVLHFGFDSEILLAALWLPFGLLFLLLMFAATKLPFWEPLVPIWFPLGFRLASKRVTVAPCCSILAPSSFLDGFHKRRHTRDSETAALLHAGVIGVWLCSF